MWSAETTSPSLIGSVGRAGVPAGSQRPGARYCTHACTRSHVPSEQPEWNSPLLEWFIYLFIVTNSCLVTVVFILGVFWAAAWLACVLQCSVTCGEGVRRREVKCIRNKHRTVDVSECRNATRPALVEACTLQECTRFQWVTAPWSKVCLSVSNNTLQGCTHFQWVTAPWSKVCLSVSNNTLQGCTRFQWVTAPWSKVCLSVINNTLQGCIHFQWVTAPWSKVCLSVTNNTLQGYTRFQWVTAPWSKVCLWVTTPSKSVPASSGWLHPGARYVYLWLTTPSKGIPASSGWLHPGARYVCRCQYPPRVHPLPVDLGVNLFAVNF